MKVDDDYTSHVCIHICPSTYMFRAIWEFVQSRDCVALLRIPRMRRQSQDCVTRVRNLEIA